MTNLLLADAVNASEPLLKTVGVPRQIIIHHQIGALQIDAFTSGVRSHENADFRVGTKESLSFQAFVPMGSAVDGYDCIVTAKHSGDFFMEIIERVAMLAENDDFAQTATGVLHMGVA